ncbi:MAG: hypothetical protein IT342_10505 [Candidatus Melainabacteria bacterium]|nr:hypothetical protein [Candidatus Melainabacteria bacterium]
MKKLAFRFAKRIAILGLLVTLALAAFAVIWACIYRLPRSQPILVDLRSGATGGNAGNDRCLMICAGLANNPHGYPGHCYIVWDRSKPERLEYADSDGFVPGRLIDLLPSLYSDISGVIADHALIGNMRNFDYLAVRLDRGPYAKARAIRARFVADAKFHTGVRDCVAYVDEIAEAAGLKTPPCRFVYPLDYIAQLKKLNSPAFESAVSVLKE